VVGRVAGPAGSATVSLGPVEVDVDVADGGQLVGITVPLRDGGASLQDREVLAALLGERADAALARADGRDPGALRLPAVGPAGRWGSLGRPGDLAVTVAALASQEIDRPGRTAVQLGVALLERARALSTLPFPTGAAGDARAGATLLLGSSTTFRAPVEVARLVRDVVDAGLLDDITGRSLARWAARLPGDEPRAATGGRRAAADLYDLAMPPRAAAAAPEPRVAAMRAPVQPLRPRLTVHPLALPGVLAGGPAPEARWVLDGNVRVTLPGWRDRAAGWWARARRPGGDTVVGVAPLVATGAGASALLLVPPHQPLDIDVVTDPSAPWPSAALAASTLAFAHGREAARADRLDRRGAAQLEWQLSATAHGEAGDETRARDARARAVSGSPRAGRVGPLVSDLLVDE
jgi:hypothetical protein